MNRRLSYHFKTYFLTIILVAAILNFVAINPVFAVGKLEMSPLHHDCGTVEEGDPAIMNVEVRNIGDADVTIKNVRTN